MSMVSKISGGLGCLFKSLFKLTSKNTSKPALLSLCEGNPPVTGGFPSQRVSNAENVSIWWRHHNKNPCRVFFPLHYQYTTSTGSIRSLMKSLKPRVMDDDVIKWKHSQRYWPFVRGIHRSPVNSPHKGQWCGALMFSLICNWINSWVNDGEAGDLIRHCTHYDVTVMGCILFR